MLMDNDIKIILDEILENVKNLNLRVSKLEQEKVVSTPTSSTLVKKSSIKEYLIEKKPTGAVQQTLVVGSYLETYKGMSSFNKDDLITGFHSARVKPPANVNDKVNMCIRSGYMMEATEKKDNRKAWTLTVSGENYIEDMTSKKGNC